ncbi:MAG: hypothetical protein QOE86_4191 [Solirubrobacteraceae bacterium]|jgi:hypothetical protein|nr:hypothetical protein [Solirubrobacteraceae bacterium]
MKLLYKPFGIIAGLIAGFISTKIFDFIWSRIDDEEPPEATTEEAPIGKVLAAAALQGLVFRTTRAYVDREGAKGFRYLTGFWPGEKKPDRA